MLRLRELPSFHPTLLVEFALCSGVMGPTEGY